MHVRPPVRGTEILGLVWVNSFVFLLLYAMSRIFLTICVVLTALLFHNSAAYCNGYEVVGQGYNSDGQANRFFASSQYKIPVSLAAGGYYSLILLSDGSVAVQGRNSFEAATSYVPPSWEKRAVAISACFYSNLILLADGSVKGQGNNDSGQASPYFPLSPDKKAVAIASGDLNSSIVLADGSVIGQGTNAYGETNPYLPSRPDKKAAAVAVGNNFSLILLADGSVVGQGFNNSNQAASYTPVNDAEKAVAIAAGGSLSLILLNDGRVLKQGYGNVDSYTPPSPDKKAVAVTVSSRGQYALFLLTDGTVIGQGYSSYGAANSYTPQGAPSYNARVEAIAAGGDHSLFLQRSYFSAPSFTPGGEITATTSHYSQKWAQQIQTGQLTSIVPNLRFVVTPRGTSQGALEFTAEPSIAADGTLSFDAKPSTYGLKVYNVTLISDSGTPNNGNDDLYQSPKILVIKAQEPSSMTVTTLESYNPYDGQTSFTESVGYAQSLGGHQEIKFDLEEPPVGGHVLKIANTMGINGELTVQKPPSGALTIMGSTSEEVFRINNSGILHLKELTLVSDSSVRNTLMRNFGIANLTNCTLLGTSEDSDNAVISNPGTVNLSNCTLSGTTMSASAYVRNSGTLNVASCTFDSYYTSGGINNIFDGVVNLKNSIIAGIISGESSGQGYNDLGYNLRGVSATTAGLETDVNGRALLKNNGGPTQTIALVANSSALNGGDPVYETSSTNFDQRGVGFLRVRNGRLDIGAYEAYTPSSPISVSVNPSSGASNTSEARTLSVVYSDGNGNADIAQARILIGSSITAGGSLYGFYDAKANKLYLYNDSGSSISKGYTPGSNATIGNSQGTLNCAATTVVRTGNTLTVNWNFTPNGFYTGAKNIYSFVSDVAGARESFKDMGDWTIALNPGNDTPLVQSLSPNSLSSNSGTARTLSMNYSDPDGVADIVQARILVNPAARKVNGLYGFYDVRANKLYLYNNAGTSLLGGFAPGSANVISNAQGSLNCAATTVVKNGNTLTVNWNLTPGASFVGTRPVYGYVRDAANIADGFRGLGTWRIAATAPVGAIVTSPSGGRG